MTIAVGARILADDILAVQGRLPIRARSTVATTFVSNTTFGNITGLSVPVAASSVYKLRGKIKYTGANATHDVKFHWVLPAGGSIEWSCYGMTAAQTANPVSVDVGTTGGDHVRGTIAGALTVILDGIIIISTTAGTAQLQAAQNVSDPGTLSIDTTSEISLQLWV